MTACARCGTTGWQIDDASGWCQLCLNGTFPHINYWSVAIPDSGIPNHEQENSMHRVLRWDVPVDDQWHVIGAGAVVHVAARTHRERVGDLVEVWTLEETPGVDTSDLRKVSVRVFGTAHQVPHGVYHIGSAVVPAFELVPSLLRGGKDHIESRAGLVWHVFGKHDPEAERAALAEQGRRLASMREDLIARGVDPGELLIPMHPDDAPATDQGDQPDAITQLRDQVATMRPAYDEATGLAYWLADRLGEHVDDQGDETLTDTVQRLLLRSECYGITPPETGELIRLVSHAAYGDPENLDRATQAATAILILIAGHGIDAERLTAALEGTGEYEPQPARDAAPGIIRYLREHADPPIDPESIPPAPAIGGFKRGHIVTIGSNGDQHEGKAGVVATLDHDHGWRLWVRVGTDVHDMHAPALYLSPDDLDLREMP